MHLHTFSLLSVELKWAKTEAKRSLKWGGQEPSRSSPSATATTIALQCGILNK